MKKRKINTQAQKKEFQDTDHRPFRESVSNSRLRYSLVSTARESSFFADSKCKQARRIERCCARFLQASPENHAFSEIRAAFHCVNIVYALSTPPSISQRIPSASSSSSPKRQDSLRCGVPGRHQSAQCSSRHIHEKRELSTTKGARHERHTSQMSTAPEHCFSRLIFRLLPCPWSMRAGCSELPNG